MAKRAKQPVPRAEETRTLDDLVEYPHQKYFCDDLSPHDLQALADDIRRHGLRNRIEILPPNRAGLPANTILDGHQRRRALQLIGGTKVPVIVRNDLADADPNTIEGQFLNATQLRRQQDPLARALVPVRLYELEKGKPRGQFGGPA